MSDHLGASLSKTTLLLQKYTNKYAIKKKKNFVFSLLCEILNDLLEEKPF